MLKLNVAILALISALGCSGQATKTPGGMGNSSKVTSIAVSVPDKRPLAASAPQIEQLMNGFMILAEPLTPNCQPGVQRIEEYGDYNAATSPTSLLQGCDYNITVAFGNRDPGAKALKATYLKNSTPYLVRKEETAGQASLNKVIAVQIQPEGAALGLKVPGAGAGLPNNPALPNNGANPGTGGAVNLAGEMDLPLTGNSGATSLSKVFKGEYMVVDLSAVNCHYCVERAKELDADRNLQQLLNGTKCSRVTLVDDLGGWAGLGFGTSSFVGQNTYQANMTATAAGRKLGVQINGTPFFLVIDRNGKVLENTEKNTEPVTLINRHCK